MKLRHLNSNNRQSGLGMRNKVKKKENGHILCQLGTDPTRVLHGQLGHHDDAIIGDGDGSRVVGLGNDAGLALRPSRSPGVELGGIWPATDIEDPSGLWAWNLGSDVDQAAQEEKKRDGKEGSGPDAQRPSHFITSMAIELERMKKRETRDTDRVTKGEVEGKRRKRLRQRRK